MKRVDLSHLAKSWPSSLVARRDFAKFSGGVYSERYMSNRDYLGDGPKGRIRIGRKVAYPIDSAIAWLEARSAVIPEKQVRQTE